MKRIGQLLAAMIFSGFAFAQTFTLTSTTLSSAMLKTDTQVCLASATGVVTPSVSAPGSIIFVDNESMQVTGTGTSSTCFTVSRSAWAAGHVSGALVYLGPPNQFFAADKQVGASCTASSEYVLPFVNTQSGNIYDCRSSGQWIQIYHGTQSSGAVGVVSAFCTGTSGSAETEYLNGAACSGATTSTARYIVASPGTLANLRVTLSAAGTGGANKDVLTVMKNGSATALTVTTGTTACATGVATACIDQTHSVAVAAGDVITFKWVSDTTDTAANVSAIVEKY